MSDRLDNAVRYEQHFGGLTTIAQYSMGYDTVSFGNQPPGDHRLGQVIDGGLLYTTGNLTATLVYDQKNGGSTNPEAAHNRHGRRLRGRYRSPRRGGRQIQPGQGRPVRALSLSRQSCDSFERLVDRPCRSDEFFTGRARTTISARPSACPAI